MDKPILKMPVNVEKEEISNLKFPKEDVLKDIEKLNELKNSIERGMKLGNSYKGKVRIVFEDSECIKSVETTIWGFTDKNVLLKKTTLIPIRRVHEIKFN